MSDPTLDAPDASGPARADEAPPLPPRRSAERDSGIACLVMIARLHGVAADPDQIAHGFAHDGRALDVPGLLLAAKQLGLVAKRVRVDPARLAKTPLPAIAIGLEAVDGTPGGADFFLLARIDQGRALIQSPGVGRPESLSLDALQAQWSGELILFTSRASIAGEMAKFDFTWFIPAVVKYRRLLLDAPGQSVDGLSADRDFSNHARDGHET